MKTAVEFISMHGDVEGSVKYDDSSSCCQFFLTPQCLGASEPNTLSDELYRQFFQFSAKICKLYPCESKTCVGSEIWIYDECITFRSCRRTTWIQPFDHRIISETETLKTLKEFLDRRQQDWNVPQTQPWTLLKRGEIPINDNDQHLKDLAKELPVIVRPHAKIDEVKKWHPMYP
jgi:hypothetical protein